MAACSAAVWHDGTILAQQCRPMARGQSEALLPMIRAVVADADLTVADVDRLAVTVGPGSFTGIRVGLAAACGLAVARSLPCVGITNLEALAAATTVDERAAADRIVALIDSKRGDIFAQHFDRNLSPQGGPSAASPEATALAFPAGRLILVGDAAEVIATTLKTYGRDTGIDVGARLADPTVVAALAASRPHPRGQMPKPLYLRSADTTMPGR